MYHFKLRLRPCFLLMNDGKTLLWVYFDFYRVLYELGGLTLGYLVCSKFICLKVTFLLKSLMVLRLLPWSLTVKSRNKLKITGKIFLISVKKWGRKKKKLTLALDLARSVVCYQRHESDSSQNLLCHTGQPQALVFNYFTLIRDKWV